MIKRACKLAILLVMFCQIWLDGTLLARSQSQEDTFTSCDGKLSFSYPEDWYVEEILGNSTLIRLANSETALEALAADRLSPVGQVIELFIFPPSLDEVNPVDTLSNLRSPYQEEFYPVQAIEVQGWSAARLDSIITYEGVEISTIRIAITFPNNQFLMLTAQAFLNLFSELDANLEILLSSLSYQALDTGFSLDEWSVYFEPKCAFRLAYPADWIVSEAYSNQILLFNSQDAQDTRRRRRDYEDDQLEVEIIQPQDLPYFFEDIGFDATDAKPEDILTAYANAERLSVGTPTPFTVGDHDVLRADFTGGFILLYDFGEGQYALLAARSSEEGFATFEETVLQIAGSVQYNPIQEDEPVIEITPTPTP